MKTNIFLNIVFLFCFVSSAFCSSIIKNSNPIIDDSFTLKTGTIRGHVIYIENVPVRNATITLFRDSSIVIKKLSGNNGEFKFEFLDSGNYKIEVGKKHYRSYTEYYFKVVPNVTFQVNLRLEKYDKREYFNGLFSRPSGKIYILDENNHFISNARIWVFKNSTDSFILTKNFSSRDDENDTNAFLYKDLVTERVGDSYYVTTPKYIKVMAKEYGDITIRYVRFIHGYYSALFIKMYPRKYLKKGDLYTLVDHYVCEKALYVIDSLVVDMKDYTNSISEISNGVSAEKVSGGIVNTYPNPVRDRLFIDINTAIGQPYRAVLMDLQGRFISETLLSGRHSELDMQWQSAGAYFIQVFDPGGTLLYAFKFLKT